MVKTVIMLKIFSLCIQARRQNSLTGGAEKIFGGHTSFLPSSLGRKTKKKDLYPGRLHFFEAQVSLGSMFIVWRSAAESNSADLPTCPQIQGCRPKKKSSERNLRRNRACYFLSEHNPGLGRHGPEILPPVAPGLCALSFFETDKYPKPVLLKKCLKITRMF